jgi:site-specific DNA-cytosine methylase
MNLLRVLSLCDGVSNGLEALTQIIPRDQIEYHAVEICEKKRFLSDLNHEGIIRPFNDVLEMAEQDSLESYDLILAGPTCTSFSSQGKREEWSGDSKIIIDCVKIYKSIQVINPKVRVLFENVASMRNEVKKDIDELIGITGECIRSEMFSAQDRNRYYWFNWEVPEFISHHSPTTESVLDPDGILMFSFSKSNRNKVGQPKIVEGRIKDKKKSNTLTTGVGCNGQSTMNKVITKNMKVRNLTVFECAKLQGMGRYSFDFVSDTEAFEAIGDAWQVDTVKWILDAII